MTIGRFRRLWPYWRPNHSCPHSADREPFLEFPLCAQRNWYAVETRGISLSIWPPFLWRWYICRAPGRRYVGLFHYFAGVRDPKHHVVNEKSALTKWDINKIWLVNLRLLNRLLLKFNTRFSYEKHIHV